jgi:hypothetical protein
MEKVTAWLDFCSVMFALGTAIYGTRQLRKGLNNYELKQNVHIKEGNQVWWTLFCLAFVSAVASLIIKYYSA